MLFQAHKGVSTENPENTLPAFEAAIAQGYNTIELDVGVTKDLVFVTLHDDTINRTARQQTGEPLPAAVHIGAITYAQALQYDFGSWFSRKFTGTKIPLFADVLRLAQQNGVQLKIDNKYQYFTPEQKAAFFELLRPFETVACLTCSRMEELENAAAAFPQMHFHYDGPVTPEILQQLHALLPRERLTVWLPHKNPNTAWVTVAFASAEAAAAIKPYARLGVWILSDEAQLAEAAALGAEIVETNGQLKPPARETRIADMHTHSEHSHDSVCPIRDMLTAQLEKGTAIFAVTDHLDADSHNAYDVFTPIGRAAETVAELNKGSGERALLLSGVEISEGFWHPDVGQHASAMLAYDAVIGSVHLVRYPQLSYAYSAIDFSKLSRETVEEYLDAYFDDVLTMLDTVDFDILAHLTCPLRYINGKYALGLTLAPYAEKIDAILRTVIRKGIALEANTSSFAALGDFMPPKEILVRYRAMGGYLVTLGSDAHTAQNASLHFEEAVAALKEIGFHNIYFFRGRKPFPIGI